MKRILLLIAACSFAVFIETGEALPQEQKYFPLGLWFVDSELPYPGYVSDNEKSLYNQIKNNWFIGFGLEAQERHMMDFCNETGGRIKMPILGDQADGLTPNLWDYYSKTADKYPDPEWCAGVDTFIVRAKRLYSDEVGFRGYGVAHEVHEDNKWAGLKYICDRIKFYDTNSKHKSLMTGGTHNYSDPHAFFDTVSSLDVFEDEHYILLAEEPYTGSGFQNALERLITEYNLDMDVFRDRHPVWHAIIHICEEKENGNLIYRQPTAAEIRVQAFLALTRGASGIKYFTYHTRPPDWYEYFGYPVGREYYGLVTFGSPRSKRWDDGLQYYPFDAVAALNEDLAVIGPTMLDFYPTAAFNSEEILSNSYIKDITGDQIINGKGTIEVGTFQDTVRNDPNLD